MNKLFISVAALAALSTVSFAEQGDHGSDGYGSNTRGIAAPESRAQTVYPDEETSTEGLNSTQRLESVKSEDRHDGHDGNAGRN